MKRFMAMLNRHKNKDPPPTKLLDLAGQLCQGLQSSSPTLEKLVEAMMGCKHKMYFLSNIHVVRACVFVHIHNGQHDTACRLLEASGHRSLGKPKIRGLARMDIYEEGWMVLLKYCKAEEKEELVQLWHEIHYRRLMETLRRDFLTPLQKFRCRQRNPPPISLCPEGLKTRNYPEEVRQHLHRFAAEVTANPDKKQREGLARDMNLQPAQVYNWFANYRRRRKSFLLHTEKFHSSGPERALTSHAGEEQYKGSYAPQPADGPHADAGSEQMQTTLVPCEPGGEHSAADLHRPPEGTYLKMLQSSCVQSTELYGVGTSTALFATPSPEPPVPSCSEAVQEPGPCLSFAVLQPRAAVSRAGAVPQQGSLVLCPCRCPPVPDEHLATWQSPCSTTGVTGSMWTPGMEAGRVPLSRVPQGGYIEGSPGRIIQQSDLELESFILREGQLGTMESVPYSSCQNVFGRPQCPPVSAPYMAESRALGQSQVLEDAAGDPVSSDTLWAACLLFEFSASRQM